MVAVLKQALLTCFVAVASYTCLSAAQQPTAQSNSNKDTKLDDDEYLQTIKNRLNQYTVQNTNLRVANVDLWKKIDVLEAEVETYRKKIKEFDEGNTKRYREVRDCEQNAQEKKADAKYYERELKKFIQEAEYYKKEMEDTRKNLTECKQELDITNSASCRDVSSTPANDVTSAAVLHLRERTEKCGKIVEELRQKGEKQAGKVEKAKAALEKATITEKKCVEKLGSCKITRTDLEKTKEDFDLQIAELETKESQLTSSKEKCQQLIDDAVAGTRRTRIILAGSGLALILWLSKILVKYSRDYIKFYMYSRRRTEEQNSLKDDAASKSEKRKRNFLNK